MRKRRRPQTPLLLLVNEVADIFRCHRQTVMRMIWAGRLKAYQMGGRQSEWRVPVDAVTAFLERDPAAIAWLARYKAERERQDKDAA